MSVTWIWFDLGYTLLYKPREEAYRGVLLSFGHDVPVDVLEREFHLVDKHFMRERPGVFGHHPGTFMPWFLGELNWRLGIRIDLRDAWERLRRAEPPDDGFWKPFPGVAEALDELRRRAYRLGVISNWDSSARPLLSSWGLEGCFEHIVVSCEVGIEKPDPGIFRVGMEKAAASPAECLYVGDNYYVDAIGARRAGMEPVILNRFGTLGVEELTDQVILGHVSELPAWLEARSSRS